MLDLRRGGRVELGLHSFLTPILDKNERRFSSVGYLRPCSREPAAPILKVKVGKMSDFFILLSQKTLTAAGNKWTFLKLTDQSAVADLANISFSRRESSLYGLPLIFLY